MSRCGWIKTSDGTTVLVNFAGPSLTLSDMAELNNYAKLRRERAKTKRKVNYEPETPNIQPSTLHNQRPRKLGYQN